MWTPCVNFVIEEAMKFVTFQRRPGSDRGGLLIEGNRVLDLGLGYSKKPGPGIEASAMDTAGLIDTLRGLSSSILEILESDDPIVDCFELEKMALAGNLEECLFTLGDTKLCAPIPRPPMIFQFNSCESHAQKELSWLLGHEDASLSSIWYTHPAYYLSNVAAVIGSSDKVAFPEDENELDVEFQVAAVTSEPINTATVEDVEDAILGYTLVCTYVARETMMRFFPLGNGPIRSKGFAISIGPYIVTKDEVKNLAEIELTAHINDDQVLSTNLSSLRFSLAEMISSASEGTVIPAGSIFCSGALGSCLVRGEFLKEGDKIEFDGDVLGCLRNEVSDRRFPRIAR